MDTVLQESLLIEADKTGALYAARILEANRQGSSAYYPAEVLERDGAKAFPAGTPVYADHPSASEKRDRPERSVKDMIGVLESGAEFRLDGLHSTISIFPQHREWVKSLAPHAGLSIRANGLVENEKVNGRMTRVLKSLTEGLSVDLVTKAGAGGKFTQVIESASASESVAESQGKESVMEKELAEALDALVLDQVAIKESQAKLAEAVTTAITAQLPGLIAEAVKKTAAAKAEDAKDGGKDDDEEDENGNVIPGKKKAAKKVKESYAEIDAALVEAKLPAPSRKRVFAAVEAGADLAEAVAEEKGYVENVLAESKVPFRGGNVQDGSRKELTEAEQLRDLARSAFGSIDGK